MFNADIFGYIATGLNIIMLLPQVFRTWKTKQTKELSLTTLLIFFIACLLWVIYGITKMATPVIIANTIVGISNLLLMIFKFKYK